MKREKTRQTRKRLEARYSSTGRRQALRLKHCGEYRSPLTGYLLETLKGDNSVVTISLEGRKRQIVMANLYTKAVKLGAKLNWVHVAKLNALHVWLTPRDVAKAKV